jgi:tripartite ATP-independent transporter DctP family solute receptor
VKNLKNMVWGILCVFVVFAFLATTGVDAALAAKKLEIRVGHGVPESNAMHQGWVKFKEVIEAESNGKMTVKIYPNQQLGGDRELIEAVQMGNLTMTAPSNSPLAAFDKEFFVLDIPFLFKDRADAYQMLDGNPGQTLLATLDNFNLKGLGYFENGFRNLTNSKNPVKSPADLDGLKLRTMENPVHLAAWKALGANPTPMAFGELFTALQQKTVDGQENPFELIHAAKFNEIQKYITKTQHIYTTYVMVINKNFYNKLSDENRAIVDKAAKAAVDYEREIAMKNDVDAEQKLVEFGNEIVELNDEQRNEFKEKLLPVADMVKEKASAEIVDLFVGSSK